MFQALRKQKRTTPIGALHRWAARWGDAERMSSRSSVRWWCDGVALIDIQARIYADYWREQNETALAAEGPLWVVLGDSTAQGLGASSPLHGYVGLVLDRLVRRTGQAWRVLNLSRSGARTADVLDHQFPLIQQLGVKPDLVTCGIGGNDVLGTAPRRFRANLRDLIQRLPSASVVLDLPVPDRFWTIGTVCSPYVTGINRLIHSTATERGLLVAQVSRHVGPPWRGKLAVDRFHPNDFGYRLLADALAAALPPTVLRTSPS